MGSGIIGTLKSGIINGLKVNIGQAVQGRAAAAVARVLPLSGIAGEAVSQLGSAVAVALAARKFAPAHATMIAAGAFANANRNVITAISPSAGALLGAYPGGGLGGYLGDADAHYIGGNIPQGASEAYGVSDYGAYPGGGLGDIGAYPGGGLGDGAMETNYLVN